MDDNNRQPITTFPLLRKYRSPIIFLLTILFFVFIHSLTSHLTLSSIDTIAVKVEFQHEDKLTAYYKIGPRAIFSDKRSASSDPIAAGKITTATINLRDRIARNLRLDPGDSPGWVKIHAMEFTGSFAHPLNFTAEEIFRKFTPGNSISHFSLQDGYVQFEVTGSDPQLILNDELVLQNRFISIVLPVVFTLAFYLALSYFGRSSFPAFYDLSHHKSSANLNYAALDGIRGIAVLLVLLDHSWGAFTGAGTGGVWIFFALSGFLLAIPFIKKPELAVSSQYMHEYLLRRLKRIIPMYYFFIVITYFMYGKYHEGAIRHLLFLQGDGHLWTIPQEMLFYLFLPFIMVANYLVFRGKPLWIVCALAVIIVLSNRYLDTSVITLHGSFDRPAFVGIFLSGILFSYLYHGVFATRSSQIVQSRPFITAASLTGITLLISFVLLSTDTLFQPKTYLALQYPGWFGFFAGMLILLALISPRSLYNRLLSWLPLRAMGLVGFSFYLLHPIIITLVKGMQDYYLGYRVGAVPQLLIVLVVTYFLSAFTYSYIERPFLKLAKKQAN